MGVECDKDVHYPSTYIEVIIREAMAGGKERVKAGGELIRDVRFADDQGMKNDSQRRFRNAFA